MQVRNTAIYFASVGVVLSTLLTGGVTFLLFQDDFALLVCARSLPPVVRRQLHIAVVRAWSAGLGALRIPLEWARVFGIQKWLTGWADSWVTDSVAAAVALGGHGVQQVLNAERCAWHARAWRVAGS